VQDRRPVVRAGVPIFVAHVTATFHKLNDLFSLCFPMESWKMQPRNQGCSFSDATSPRAAFSGSESKRLLKMPSCFQKNAKLLAHFTSAEIR
jgi:hypothetical protein